MKGKSTVFVLIQFGCLFFLAASGAILPTGHVFYIILFFGSLALGIAAVLAMDWDQFSVFPDPKKSGKLVTRWPYSMVRHPMYTAAILACSIWVIHDFTWIRFLVLFVLVINQVLKTQYEEELLTAKFPEYREYSLRTKKLIPFIY